LSTLTQPGHEVVLSGTVSDQNPASVRVTFSGAVSGSTTSDSTGHYSFTTSGASLGAVNAQGIDGQNLTSNVASAAITDTAPALSLNIVYGTQKNVTLSGKVADIDLGGLTVTFTGQVSGSTTTASDGTFSLTTSAAGLGAVSGSTVDKWGVTSNVAQVSVAPKAPVISNFTGSEGPNNMWYFDGSVSDYSPDGLVVTFGGVPELQGKTATVDQYGNFYVTAQLSETTATVTAQTTDAYGQNSNQAWYTI
jgi:hypothetical protein